MHGAAGDAELSGQIAPRGQLRARGEPTVLDALSDRPNRSGQPAGSFWRDRVGWGGQPSRDGTAEIGNLGPFLWLGATHLFAMTEEKIIMKAIVVTDDRAGRTAG
jgi:hypothetical protein